MLFTYISFSEQKILNFRDKVLIFSFIFSVLYGVSDELHQYFVPNRLCDLYDVLADAAGAAAGLLIVILNDKRKIKLTYIK